MNHPLRKAIREQVTNRRVYFLVASLAIAWFVLESSFVFVMKIFFTSIGLLPADRNQSSGLELSITLSITLLVGYAGLRALVNFTKIYLMESDRQRSVADLKNQIFKRILNSTYRRNLDQSITSHLLNQEVTKVGDWIRLVHSAVFSSVAFVCLACICFYYAPIEMAFSLVILSFFFPVVALVNRFTALIGDRSVQANMGYVSRIEACGNAIKEIKAYGGEGEVFDDFKQVVEQQQWFLVRHETFKGLKQVVPTFLGICLISIVAILSSRYIKTEPVFLLSFFYVFVRFSQNLSHFLSALTGFSFLQPSVEKVQSFLSRPEDVGTTPHLYRDTTLASDVLLHIKSVTFKDGTSWNSKAIGRSILEGEFVVVFGHSGSGKSLLLSKLLGLVESDEILFNEVVSRESLAYVGPEPIGLYGLSAQENLLFLNPTAGAEDLQKALQVACVDFLDLDQASDSFSFESLSTGQLMRLDFARALLRNPKILILDEATSHLDSELEARVLENIRTAYPNTSVILASHRRSLQSYADYMIDLDLPNE